MNIGCVYKSIYLLSICAAARVQVCAIAEINFVNHMYLKMLKVLKASVSGRSQNRWLNHIKGLYACVNR